MIEYDIEVSNNGNDPAPATTFELLVPSGVTVIGESGAISGCAPLPATNTTLTCNVPQLGPLGGAADLLLEIEAPTEGFFAFTASVPASAGGVTDSDSGNNSNPQATTITQGADIALTLTAPATASSGSIVPLVWTATNNGPNNATAMDLRFDIPTGFIITSAPAGCSLAGSTYTCSVGAISAGGSTDLTFQGQISAAGGSTVSGAASIVNVAPGDPITSDNTETFNLNTTGGTDLAVMIFRAPGGTLLVGDDITWTVS